jgi:hypothetical protein
MKRPSRKSRPFTAEKQTGRSAATGSILPWYERQVTCYRNIDPQSKIGHMSFDEARKLLDEHAPTVGEQQDIARRKLLCSNLDRKSPKYRAEKNELNARKGRLFCFTPSGICPNGRTDAELTDYNGIMLFDFDDLWSAGEQERVWKAVMAWQHTGYARHSVSEAGIKVAVPTTATREQHRPTWLAIATELAKLTGHEVDPSTYNLSRVWFTSRDADAYFNREAVLFSAVDTPPPKPERQPASQIAGLGEPESVAEKRRIAEACGVKFIDDFQPDGTRQNVYKANIECPDKFHDPRVRNHASLYLNADGSLVPSCFNEECQPAIHNLKLGLDERVAAHGGELPAIIDATTFIDTEIVLPPDVIKGILHLGGKIVLGGGSKSFKTWQQLDLAASIATGTPWLGFPTQQGRVLCLNFEIPAPFYNWRIQTVCRAKGVQLQPNQFYVWNLRGYAMDVNDLVPKIIERIKDAPTFALMDLDPIYKVLGQWRDENKAGDVAELLNAVERLAVKSGAAVLFGSHFSKGNQAAKEAIDRISGSGVFGRDPDSILTFTRHAQEDVFALDFILRNHRPQEAFCVRWKFPLMERDDSLDPADLKQQAKRAGRPRETSDEKLLALLEPQPLTAGTWQERAEQGLKMSEGTFWRRLRELRESGRIKKNENEEWCRTDEKPF